MKLRDAAGKSDQAVEALTVSLRSIPAEAITTDSISNSSISTANRSPMIQLNVWREAHAMSGSIGVK
jgi:hypothetical protein